MTAPRPAAPVRHRVAPAPAPRPRPKLRVVRPNELSPRARRRRRNAIAVAGALLVSLGLLAVVASHVVLSQGQHRLAELQHQAVVSQRRYDQLRLEVARLESPARIVAAAEALGMVEPDSVEYLTPEAQVEEPAPPAAESGEAPKRQPAAGTSGWTVVKPHLSVVP